MNQTDPTADDLATARATNRRLNHEKQRLESELATFRRAVAQWEISDRGAYVPLRTLAAIATAAGLDVPDRWELHFERVERLEAELRRRTAEPAAASAVVSPPTNRAALRDRVADAIARVDAGSWGTEVKSMHPYWQKGYRAYADAVLAVLGEQTDRAAVLWEAAAAIEAEQAREEATEWARFGELDHETEIGRGYVLAAAALLRRLAVEAHDTGTQQQEPTAETLTDAVIALHAETGWDTPGCDCGHQGMGPKWHAKACAWLATMTVPHPDDVAQQQPDTVAKPSPRLSIQHADALWDAIAPPGDDRPSYPVQHERVCRVVADIVDEVTAGAGTQQPDTEAPTVERPAVLREIATTLDQLAETDVIRKRRSLATARRLLAVELRRMADEPAPVAQQPAAAPCGRLESLPGPCSAGDHCCKGPQQAAAADGEEVWFGMPGCTCRAFTRQDGSPRYLEPHETVDKVSGWEPGADCPHHAPRP